MKRSKYGQSRMMVLLLVSSHCHSRMVVLQLLSSREPPLKRNYLLLWLSDPNGTGGWSAAKQAGLGSLATAAPPYQGLTRPISNHWAT